MIATRETRADRLVHAVRQEHAPIVAEHGIAHRGVDTDARRATRDDQILDALLRQPLMEVGLEESAEPGLVDHEVLRLRLQLGDDIAVPRVANENPAGAAVRGVHRLAYAELEMTQPIRGVGRAEIGQIRQVRHFQVHDPEPGAPRRGQSSCRRRDRALDARDIDAGAIEHPAARAEIVLHVDDDDGGLRGIERERSRSSLELDGSAGRPLRATRSGHGDCRARGRSNTQHFSTRQVGHGGFPRFRPLECTPRQEVTLGCRHSGLLRPPSTIRARMATGITGGTRDGAIQ